MMIEGVAKLVRTKSTPFLNRNIMLQIGKEGFLDGTKAKNELGWVPQISLEEGCRQYVQWRRNKKKNP
jgi:nucleoside-diphosphate-sugar epimerase